MAVYKGSDIPNCEAPDDLFDSLVIQCNDVDFGLSKKSNNPQIVSKWEVLGVPTKDGKIEQALVRNGVSYIMAGLTILPYYFTLTKKAMRFYAEFWTKANQKPMEEFTVDDENPDLGFMKNLVMTAVVKAIVSDKTRPLSEDEMKILQEAGKPLKGEVVTDEDGNPLQNKFLQIDRWNRKWLGEVPAF